MKIIKYELILVIFILTSLLPTLSYSQYVNIPDPAFRNWLINNGFAGCMSGGQLDTTCTAVSSAHIINCNSQGIYNLSGIESFSNLDTLICDDNNFTAPPTFPRNLKKLSFNRCVYFFVPITLPNSLEYLECTMSQLVGINNLPNTLKYIDCHATGVDSLPPLPDAIKYLNCTATGITKLNFSPNSQCTRLECGGLGNGYPAEINRFPPFLEEYYGMSAGFSSLPPFPSSLKTILCGGSPIHQLPALPDSLLYLNCEGTFITSLPTLPPNLQTLYCSGNSLGVLPTLNNSLEALVCENCNLTSLPDFPPSLTSLHCRDNPLLTCLPLSNNLNTLYMSGTGITCIPYSQHVSGQQDYQNFPRCELLNVNNCPVRWNIKGTIYSDRNEDCQLGLSDEVLQNVKLQLWSNGQLLQQAFTQNDGQYFFAISSAGQYNIVVDTTSLSLRVFCPSANNHSVNISLSDTTQSGIDFGMICKPLYDLGVTALNGRFRAADTSLVSLAVGGMYGAHCGDTVSGQVKVVINGPIKYTSAANGASTPSIVNNDTLIWNVNDFSAVDIYHNFNFLVVTDSFAFIGQEACFNIFVTPTVGDFDSSNNSSIQCFTIYNSYDPNEKTASLHKNLNTSENWITYTIHFQNTGNDTARNIFLIDTIDTNLDISTVKLLYSTHNVFTQILPNNTIKFNYSNIYLVDSITNEPLSKGFVQFKIRIANNWNEVTPIKNTAYITFDFNEPVKTNTTITGGVTGLNDNIQNVTSNNVVIYPNPSTSKIHVETFHVRYDKIIVYDINGRKLKEQEFTDQLDVNALKSGVYFVEIFNETDSVRRMFIKQ